MKLQEFNMLKFKCFKIWTEMSKYLQENGMSRSFYYDSDGVKIKIDYITDDVKDFEVFLQPDPRGINVLTFQDYGNEFTPGFIPKQYLENDNWMEDFKKRVILKKHQMKMEADTNIRKIKQAKKVNMLKLAEELDVYRNGKWQLERLGEID